MLSSSIDYLIEMGVNKVNTLEQKVVVITGASGGIGAHMAIKLSTYGAIPILLARSKERLGKISDQIQGQHDVYVVDVSSKDHIFEVISLILSKYGKIDIFINNAGYAVFNDFLQLSLNEIEEMMMVNYFGVVYSCKAVLPSMIERNSGHIINVASMAGKVGSAKSSAYAASKHAVLGFTNSLRQELNKTNIIVSSLNCGPIDTPLLTKADVSGDYKANLPKWFILEPETVTKAILDIIANQKVEKNIPLIANMGSKILQILPRSLDKITAKITNRK
ncbi:SDR family NAD(P)-dependent oxidoreductase [Chengkuizengella axinellae]|uniref:SDR family NAD(P)-dependent oxidoreductase n=1 Tax=Chengkuizengella axinellae TaxID=3064388 RepID=A0ABT9ITG6_9BACL|nr:SDR family NAD(P)-dependent oxidoreductase [Chengkuizengella sp. 2205SS18-9]MDP5272628.1 SDR family NAD(P)-dependent oxidoreductase [Chengkuizengella sp. 2205SS18-9]